MVPPFFWSPDSRFIGFQSGGKLAKIEISGGPAQTMCDVQGTVVGGSWNRDGVIVFADTHQRHNAGFCGWWSRISADHF